ncbi:MAG: hypothetical protein GX075_06825 [Firmicutes bacterium]|nr:hypothetical protein [Bacillota bacterium]
MMRKLITVIIATLILSLSGSLVARGGSYSLEAENGKINAPAGLGFEVKTNFRDEQNFSFASIPVTAKLSYGIRPSVTISGEVSRNGEEDPRMLLKGYYSPSRSSLGYTAYLGYDFSAAEIPMYGVSVWLASDQLYGFINFEADQAADDTALTVTPGVNFGLGSKIRLAGEVGYDIINKGYKEVRLGASYELVDNFNIKIGVAAGFEEDAERVYTTGLAMEI